MTLRDCSLLMGVPKDPEKPIRACLADLDPKGWHGPGNKLDHWLSSERALISEGYYEGSDHGIGKGESEQLQCVFTMFPFYA